VGRLGAWKPGQSGNPNGRPPAGESFAEALRERLTARHRKKLADKVIALALAGDIRAMVFIRDTLDGRPVQALEHSGPERKPILLVEGPKVEGDSYSQG
jgi:hypothetical protein